MENWLYQILKLAVKRFSTKTPIRQLLRMATLMACMGAEQVTLIIISWHACILHGMFLSTYLRSTVDHILAV